MMLHRLTKCVDLGIQLHIILSKYITFLSLLNFYIHKITTTNFNEILHNNFTTTYNKQNIIQKIQIERAIYDCGFSHTAENDKKVATILLMINFGSLTVAGLIYANYQRLVIRPCVPNPRCCFKFQDYGHVSSNCAKLEVCGQCNL